MAGYSLEECALLWREAGQHGTPAERIQRAEKWLAYYDYAASHRAGGDSDDGDDTFPAYLIREGIVHPSDTVLDIGAGMGSDSLAFAAHCQSVTALEPSPGCQRVTAQRAACRGLDNITQIQSFWEQFETEERFDVCFSSMCPAVCDPDELERMEALSRRLCCIVTVMRGSKDRHRSAMMAELGIRPRGGMVTELIHYYNVLYLKGRLPNVQCRTVKTEYDIPADRLLEQYPIYFEIFGIPRADSVSFLKRYLDAHGTSGFLHEESVIHYGLLWWTV